MSIWSLFTKSEPSLELEAGMTIPAPPPESCAPAAPISMWERAYQDSVRPFEAEAIGALRTYRGVAHGHQRQVGIYAVRDDVALADVRAYARAKRAALFTAAVEATALTEQFFNDGTFSDSEWVDAPSQSGVRCTQPNNDNMMLRVG
jgi:hypothetical protein